MVKSETVPELAGKGDKAEADQNLELLETDEEEIKLKPGIHRQKHTRSTQKKTKSKSELTEKAAKIYLGGIGINWPLFQRVHTRPGNHFVVPKAMMIIVAVPLLSRLF